MVNCVFGPMQSGANWTGLPTNAVSGATTFMRDAPLARLPFGRPKWLIKMVFAPWFCKYFMVGRLACRRVSSVMAPMSLHGTLKSTRTSTVLPATSASSSLRKSTILSLFLALNRFHDPSHIDHTASKPPLIVIPSDDFNQFIVHNFGQRGGKGGRMWVVV